MDTKGNQRFGASVGSGEAATSESRRAFLARGIGACVAFLGAVIGIPAIGAAIAPALRPAEANWIELGKGDTFPDGVPTSAEFSITRKDGWIDTTEIKAVWVVRNGQDFTVFNGRCTHLGCAYRWQPDKNQFICPCHAGLFGKDGRVVGGPPPRGLDTMETRIEGGNLQVQYGDFRLGTEEKVPA